jgi:iron complex outermembrane receptor protein
VFGEGTLPFTDTWRATGGVRFDHMLVKGTEVYSSASNPFGLVPGANVVKNLMLAPGLGTESFNNVTFKVRLEKDLTASNMLYGTVSTGFLPGDVEVAPVAVPGVGQVPAALTYNQKRLTAYEIGSKNRFIEDRLQLNGDLFYYDYIGYQTFAITNPLTTADSGFTLLAPDPKHLPPFPQRKDFRFD